MENPSFEDVFPIENLNFPASHLSFQGGIYIRIWAMGCPGYHSHQTNQACLIPL